MSLFTICDDMFLQIASHLETNKDMHALSATCSRFWKLGLQYGYLREIEFGHGDDYREFVKQYTRNKKTLTTMKIKNIVDPIVWIPSSSWLKTMIFERCCMDNMVINPNMSETETLVIYDSHRGENTKISINWKKLPSLRVLDIYANNIEMKGLDACSNLEAIRIDLVRTTRLPDFIAELPKLKFLATTCLATTKLHFISKTFSVCFVPKLKSVVFTANSDIIPASHLKDYPSVNIQCYNLSEYL